MDVYVMPTHKPLNRTILPTLLCADKAEQSQEVKAAIKQFGPNPILIFCEDEASVAVMQGLIPNSQKLTAVEAQDNDARKQIINDAGKSNNVLLTTYAERGIGY